MLLRSLAVWLILIAAEILHGIARRIFLVPYVCEFRSNQIGVFTGSLIVFAIALISIRWIGATRTAQLFGVGCVWLVLTLAFELLFGHFVAGESWERLASDYKILNGGLLPLGMLFLALSPWIAAQVRGIKDRRDKVVDSSPQ